MIFKAPGATEIENLALDLVVVLVILGDAGNAMDLGLIIEPAYSDRTVLLGVVDQELGPLLHLRLGGSAALYGASRINEAGDEADWHGAAQVAARPRSGLHSGC